MLRHLSILLLVCSANHAVCQVPKLADDLRMRNVSKRFVKETGREVVIVGSWTGVPPPKEAAGSIYRPGISDHDMRLVMPAGTTEQEAIAAWQQSQTKVRQLIQEEFGTEAQSVLNRTNVYAPTQIMKGVETADDALDVYTKARRVPNLGYTGPVTKQTNAKWVEGLYGQGSQTWTQGYEATRGRVIYRQGGAVYTGLTDLTHLSEGVARYSAAGMGNTSAQWAEKATEAIANGDVGSLSKYLDRLQRDLAKGKDLARFRVNPAFQDELRSLSNALRPNAAGKINEAAYRQLRSRVVVALQRGAREAAILQQAQKAAGAQRALLQSLLDDFTKQTYLSDLIKKAAQQIPFDKILTGLMVYLAVSNGSAVAGEKGALEGMLAMAPWMASLPVGLMTEMTRAVLSEAEAAGLRFVTSSQDPWELMSGIYTVVGRAGADAGRAYTLDSLVRLFWNEERLKGIVFWKCKLATARNLGEHPDKVDERAAWDLYDRVWPLILQAWQFEREKLRIEYFTLLDEVQRMPMVLTYKPEPALLPRAGGVLVTVSAASLDRDGGGRVDRIFEILKILGGNDVYAQGRYDWPGGGEQPAPSARQFRFTNPGIYPVVCKYVLLTGGTAFGSDSPMVRMTTVFAGVDVEVIGQAPPQPNESKAPQQVRPPAAKPVETAKGQGGVWVLQPDPEIEENGFVNQDRRITGGNNTYVGKFQSGMVTLRTAWAWGEQGQGGVRESPIMLESTHSWTLPERMVPREKVLVPMKISGIKYTWKDARRRGYTLTAALDIYQKPGQVIGRLGKGVNDGSPDRGAPVEVSTTGEFTPPLGKPGDTFTIIVRVYDGGSTSASAKLVYKYQ